MRRLLNPGVKLCGVIKGNGFGHGLVPAARALVAGGTEWLAVDSLEEALSLRAANISVPLIVLYWTHPWQAPRMARERIQPSVWDEAWVTAAGAALSLSSSPDPLQIHLVIDTGLGREGCLPNAAAMLARSVVGAAAAGGADMRVAGVSTHFVS